MKRIERVDVAIVGAGSAGLAALSVVRRSAKSFVVIDGGPLGTLCARAGCMPSKALIQAANEFHRASRARGRGMRGGGKLSLNIPEALAWVRRLRDGFTEGPTLAAEGLGRRLIRGRARFIGPRALRVGEREIHAGRVILATGSRPVVPEEFLALGSKVVTTDALFDLKDLPARIGVIGLGSIGLELGQALSRLGCDVMAFDRSRGVGNLTDPAVIARALRLFSREFPIRFGAAVRLSARGETVVVRTGGHAYARDLILASLGRRPNLEALGLEAIGVRLDERGLPPLDAGTMKVRGRPIYLAGDASALHPVLHEAADDGRIAGLNSVRRRARPFPRRAPLSITFSEPNLAIAGAARSALAAGSFVTGAADFAADARSLILGENRGLLHVYARVSDRRFLGGEMAGPAGEHLGHLMAWALQRGLTVDEMLGLPFYHPSVEEALRSALRDAAGKLRLRARASAPGAGRGP